MSIALRWGAVAVLTTLLLSACASPTLKDFHDAPSGVDFTVIDMRPAADKIALNGSLAHNNCLYNVFQIEDSYTKATRLVLFRHELEEKLGAKLQDKAVSILQYRLYMNLRTLPAAASAAIGDGVGPRRVTGAAGCVLQQDDAGWLAASRPDAASSWVVEIRATTGGKDYSVVAVTKFAEVVKTMSYGDGIFFAMRRANALIIEKMGEDLRAM